MSAEDEAAARVRSVLHVAPSIGVVLGSGLGAFVDSLDDPHGIPFADIPGFPTASVAGHAGRLVAGTLSGVPVAVLAGRVHGYEGYSAQEVTFPIRVLKLLGVRSLLVTNASGCINPAWSPGDLMRITDHINLSGRNPLVGPNDARFGPRFPDLSHAYDGALGKALDDAATTLGMTLRRGVYAHVLGPSYETPAEIRMLRTLGADAVGMSTVPEIIAAVHAGMRVAALACLTNMAAGITGEPLAHADVTARAAAASGRVIALLKELIPRLPVPPG